MAGDFVLVVGSAVLEISGRTGDRLQPGARQYGPIHASVSGVARNIAIAKSADSVPAPSAAAQNARPVRRILRSGSVYS